MTEDEIATVVIGKAIEVHRKPGPGLLESAYTHCLAYELGQEFQIKQEVPMPIVYKEVKLEYGYRMDILVEDKLVVEIKAVEALTDVHKAQLLTYLKLGDYKLGLIINFNVVLLKLGIKRIIN